MGCGSSLYERSLEPRSDLRNDHRTTKTEVTDERQLQEAKAKTTNENSHNENQIAQYVKPTEMSKKKPSSTDAVIPTEMSKKSSNNDAVVPTKISNQSSNKDAQEIQIPQSKIPAYNDECLQLANKLFTEYPNLQDGFTDINDLIWKVESDVSKSGDPESVKNLVSRIAGKSYVNREKEDIRHVYSDYMSYVRFAEAVYSLYKLMLNKARLEYLTLKTATAALSREDYLFLRQLRTILWNFTDAGLEFSERVCSTGILRCLVGDLKLVLEEAGDPSKVSISDTIYRSCRGILHNCSNNTMTRQPIRDLGTVQVAMGYLKGDAPVIKVTILLLLANIINEEDNKILMGDDTVFLLLLKMITYAWKQERHRCEGFSASELIVGLTGLAKNDKNKTLIMSKGALPVLIMVMQEGSDAEKEAAAKCTWELAFDNDNAAAFRENDELQNVLKELKTSKNTKVQKALEGILWEISDGKQPKVRGLENGRSPSDKAGHIMISYQWADQKTLVKVKDALRKHGFKVWMDIDNMEGSTLQAMAEAVQNASVVLVCMSERYKLSQNCRSEAEYAFELHKTIVPLLMQRQYKADGWLGLIKGAKLHFDLSGKYPFEQKLGELVKELRRRVEGCEKGLDNVDGEATAIVKSQPTDIHRGQDTFIQWSGKDVRNWLSKIGLEKHGPLAEVTGRQLGFLYKLSSKAPEFFYSYLKTDLRLTNLEDLMNFSEAVENLS